MTTLSSGTNPNNLNVDKGVCTNDVLEDLHRAIKFEAVFSTLIENKILSIKRECEEKRKQKRSLVRFLFGGGRRNVASLVVDPNIEAFPVASAGNGGVVAPNPTATSMVEYERQGAAVDQQQERQESDDFQRRNPETSSLNGRKYVECSPSDLDAGCGGPELRNTGAGPEFEYKYDAISIQSDTCRTGRCLSNDLVLRHQRTLPLSGLRTSGMVAFAQREDKRSQSDDFIARSKNHSGSNVATRMDPEFSCPQSAMATRKYVDDRLMGPRQPPSSPPPNVLHHPAQSPPAASILTSSSSSLSQSVNSKSTGTKVGHQQQKMEYCSTTKSHNNLPEGAVKLSPREASVLLEQERNRLRVFEQRSISAQCSPIMPRHIEFDSIVSLSNSAPISLHPIHDDNGVASIGDPEDIADKQRTGGRVQETVTTTTVKSHRRHGHKSKSQRAAEYLAAQIDFDSLASYPLVNPKTQGIISSFNQLKSPNLPMVIPMRPKKGANDNHPQSAASNTDTTTATSYVTTTTTGVGGESAAQQVGKVKKGGSGGGGGGRSTKGRDDDNNELRQSSEFFFSEDGEVKGNLGAVGMTKDYVGDVMTPTLL